MGYKIGTTSGGMVTLASLGIPDPKGEYFNYSDLRNLGDGTVRGVGYPRAVWRWGFLSRADRDALRTYCTGVASSAIYIQTRTLDSTDVFDDFSATMIWPAEEERSAGRRLSFEIEFRNLVAV